MTKGRFITFDKELKPEGLVDGDDDDLNTGTFYAYNSEMSSGWCLFRYESGEPVPEEGKRWLAIRDGDMDLWAADHDALLRKITEFNAAQMQARLFGRQQRQPITVEFLSSRTNNFDRLFPRRRK